MAAATISDRSPIEMWPFHVQRVKVSSMTSGQLENIAHGGPSGENVFMVLTEFLTDTNTGDIVQAVHVAASDSTTNNTVAVKFTVESGGDITGSTAYLYFYFPSSASGGIG